MLLWMIIIIILTISMILTYYLLPNTPEPLLAQAYAILLIALGVMYRVYRKIRQRRVENMIEELNYLRMRVAQLEGEVMTEEDLQEQESEI